MIIPLPTPWPPICYASTTRRNTPALVDQGTQTAPTTQPRSTTQTAATQTEHAVPEPHAAQAVEERLGGYQDISTQIDQEPSEAHTVPALEEVVTAAEEVYPEASNMPKVTLKASKEQRNAGVIERSIAKLARKVDSGNGPAFFQFVLSEMLDHTLKQLCKSEEIREDEPIPTPVLEAKFAEFNDDGSWNRVIDNIEYGFERPFPIPDSFEIWIGQLPDPHPDSEAAKEPNFNRFGAKAPNHWNMIGPGCYISRDYPGVWAIEDKKAFRVFRWEQRRQIWYCQADMIGIGYEHDGDQYFTKFLKGHLYELEGMYVWPPGRDLEGPGWIEIKNICRDVEMEASRRVDFRFSSPSDEPFVFGQGR